jgi:hypothetical protein
MSFIAWYLSLYLSLTSTGTVKTRLPTQTKKISYFCNISQKMLYFTYLLQFPKNPQIYFFSFKNPLSWQPFFGPCTSKSHCAGAGLWWYLFIFYWRIYHMVREFNFTVRKSLIVPLLINDKYQDKNFKIKTKILKF